MNWPSMIPEDLRKRLDTVLGFRSYGSADMWAEIKEWLEKHDIEPPKQLPERVRDERFYDQ